MSLSAEEKRRFLKALEEDQEFRYAVAGLLGLGELLAELKKLREDFNNYVKRSERLWRRHERRWRQNEKRWREANKRFSRLEETLGAMAESQYSRYIWEDLKEEVKARGESVIRRVRSAKVDNVDVDLLVETDKRVYVVEVKIMPRIEDVWALLTKTEVVKAASGKEAVPILTGTRIGDDVEKYARGKGVLIYSY
ncbi:paREP7 [Pyrobaculum oguniense TE7]|uniref:PaREP7 n=1 Tax=Pyrobaculum oguniense (strain DSM 13380 / JCM 10595 / TE7) TaxID=698757 RepID=H6QAQ6_PYROT|nr:paREP7 [Pyrobaculum oguniense TE7]